MTRYQSSAFRYLLFFVGAGIVVLAFFLSKGDRELTRIDAFVWVSIGIMYLIFFIPFFFSSIRIGNFTGKIPVLPLVWLGIILYIVASTVIILLITAYHFLSLNAAIIIQAIVLFLFFIDVYIAYFASTHVRRVAAKEKNLRQLTGEIKSKAQSFSLLVNRLPAEHEKAQKILKQVLEDIRYISPVKDAASSDLESKILYSLNMLSEFCRNIQTSANPAALEPEAVNLQMLVKERKLLRN